MKELDLSGSPPHPATLEEAHQVIDQLWSIVRALRERVESLEEQLKVDSSNSSKAPSSDSAEKRAQRRKKPRSNRRRGAQPGHPKHERELVPESEVDEIERFYPESTCACGSALTIGTEPSVRHQVFDVPLVHYEVTEYQLYSGHCAHCQSRTTAQLPDWVPSGQMGPGLISWIGILSGQFHLTTRKMQRFLIEQWQLKFSTGAISQAQGKMIAWLTPLYHQIGDHVRQAEVAHADETTHYRKTERRWLWCLTTPLAVYMLTHYSRGKAAAMALLGSFSGVLVTDHYAGYNDYLRALRQLCWAHLIRRFERIAQRTGDAGDIGQRLLLIAHAVIRTRHRWQNGQLTGPQYHRRMKRLRRALQKGLEQGQACSGSSRTVNQCAHVLKDEALYWTFLNDPQIPLTNNAAERALRSYVLWRKISFATQSHRGDQFRPMVLSVIETAQRLGISTSRLMREVCAQGLRGDPITTRLPLPNPTLRKIAK
jgi:transposase